MMMLLLLRMMLLLLLLLLRRWMENEQIPGVKRISLRHGLLLLPDSIYFCGGVWLRYTVKTVSSAGLNRITLTHC